MACVDSVLQTVNVDSEREEGEIVDDLDDFSDISSEEEFLLRQRLSVLENYNNVLERKQAKRASNSSIPDKDNYECVPDLSEISTSEFEVSCTDHSKKSSRKPKQTKCHYRKRKKNFHTDHQTMTRQKNFRSTEKKIDSKTRIQGARIKKKSKPIVIPESSEESDDEVYRNKRRKLANAVVIHKDKVDNTSLKARLMKMYHVSLELTENDITNNIKKDSAIPETLNDVAVKEVSKETGCDDNTHIVNVDIDTVDGKNNLELIDICDTKSVNIDNKTLPELGAISSDITADKFTSKDTEHTNIENNKDGSDDDLEILRQHALQTKALKVTATKPIQISNDSEIDSDTEELRLICLRSALLKRAIEIKMKQKMRKRLSQSSIGDDLEVAQEKVESDNNTDIESVDMDIGVSDGPEDEKDKIKTHDTIESLTVIINNCPSNSAKNEEVDEDEDLLRAKLLTSLSKSLPKLINNNVEKTTKTDLPAIVEVDKPAENGVAKEKVEEKRFVINTGGDSDSCSDNEATKNLTKMHIKLSEQVDFQQKLDVFLKSTRMEVEKNAVTTLTPNTQATLKPVKLQEKFVPKAVNHLPKTEQMEYKNLVKRMAELEKLKKARQAVLDVPQIATAKDTLKPRNITLHAQNQRVNLDEQIAKSRKNIAEESVKVLKLKEQGIKLSQKYKIVTTELKNLLTAITLNKREQRIAQSRLTKIRTHHQVLLKRTSALNKIAPRNQLKSVNKITSSKLQKENEPIHGKEENKLEPKVCDVSKKITKTVKEKTKENCKDNENKSSVSNKTEQIVDQSEIVIATVVDDYQSPLQAIMSANWDLDPNGVLCPFEVAGICRDSTCSYLHTSNPSAHNT